MNKKANKAKDATYMTLNVLSIVINRVGRQRLHTWLVKPKNRFAEIMDSDITDREKINQIEKEVKK